MPDRGRGGRVARRDERRSQEPARTTTYMTAAAESKPAPHLRRLAGQSKSGGMFSGAYSPRPGMLAFFRWRRQQARLSAGRQGCRTCADSEAGCASAAHRDGRGATEAGRADSRARAGGAGSDARAAISGKRREPDEWRDADGSDRKLRSALGCDAVVSPGGTARLRAIDTPKNRHQIVDESKCSLSAKQGWRDIAAAYSSEWRSSGG